VFSDGFQELELGDTPHFDTTNPAICFKPERGSLGNWSVATSLRHEGFDQSWEIQGEGGKIFLAQTFTNLNDSNEPLSLITHPLILAGDTLWKDYTLEVEFTPLAKFDKCGVVFKYKNPTDFYFFGIEGNTVTLKQVQQSVTPLRPIERILDFSPLVWTPGEKLHATVTVRRNRIFTVLNDSIYLHADGLPLQSGKIGLISDLPARFHRVEVKILKGEQRKLARRKRQIGRREELVLSDHPQMVRWRRFNTTDFGTNHNIKLGDLTGDGNKEIVFIRPDADGSYIQYICAMNLEGETLWEYGDAGTAPPDGGHELPVQVHDLDGDGTREVIFVSEQKLQVLEGRTGKHLEAIRIPGSGIVKSMVFGDLAGVGRDNCIVLADHLNRIVVLNERLELLWQYKTETGSCPMVYDMDGDGRHEVLMGYTVIDPEGNLLFDVGAFIGDVCNGVSVNELMVGVKSTPALVYAAGDWGLIYFDFNGNLLKQNIMGHVHFFSVADYDAEQPGLEIATSNLWGSDGLVHVLTSSGEVISKFLSPSGPGRCEPVNWKGDGEEFFITSADSLMGGMVDAYGHPAVRFPSDGHPATWYMVQDLTGDARDEVLVWDHQALWIYTQDDNPRMGNTYDPDRLPAYNRSMHQMSRSLPGW